jgi:predicted PurR-regulated permease PerM
MRRILFFSIGILAVLIVGYLLSPVLNPFLIALGIAYILNPIVSFFERKHVPRIVTVLGLFIIIIAAFAMFLLFTVPELVKQASNMPTRLFGGEYTTWVDANGNEAPDFNESAGKLEYEDWNNNERCDGGYLDRLRWWIEKKTGKSREEISAYMRKMLASSDTQDKLQATIGNTVSGITDWSFKFLTSLFNLILIPIYMFFLMLEIGGITSSVKRYLPSVYKQRMLDVAKQINEAVSGFFRGRLLICLIIGAITWLGLFICGIQFSGILAVTTAVSILVPLLWIPLGMGPAMMFAYFDYGFTWPFFCVPVIYVIIQIVDAVLQPLIIGKYAGLHPITLILSIFLFGFVLGTYGVLLAVPLMCILKILGREFLLPVLKQYADEENAGVAAPDGEDGTPPPSKAEPADDGKNGEDTEKNGASSGKPDNS